jgi:uncharacterized protein DUF2330
MANYRALLVSLTVATLLGSSLARADGCYVPEKAVVKLPKIPVQRAVVAYRNGRETLMVESTAKGEGTRFGWILPVPGKPESVQACSPGALRSLAMAIQPRIVHELSTRLVPLTWLSLLIIVLFVIAAASKRKPQRTWGKALVRTAVYGGLMVIVLAVVIPSLLAARRSSLETGFAPGISVVSRERVGSYEVTSLRADNANALYAWLEKEKLAVPAELKPVVAEYTRDGWFFVTAKLVVEEGQAIRAHPLKISFATERAVYPMKLTALNGSRLDLELYVIGEQAAGVPGMKRVFCDRFADAHHSWSAASLGHALGSYEAETLPVSRGEHSNLEVGHPGLRKLMWNGCWLSKLSGKISPAAMSQDFYVNWSEPVFVRERLYSERGAWGTGWIVAVIILVLCVPVALIMWGTHRMGNKILAASLAGTLAAALMTAGLVRMSLPVADVGTYGGKGRIELRDLHEFAFLIEKDTREGKLSSKEALKRLRKKLPGFSNLYTGGPMLEEDSPGNYTLAEEKGRPVVTIYDLGGTPVRMATRIGGNL